MPRDAKDKTKKAPAKKSAKPVLKLSKKTLKDIGLGFPSDFYKTVT